MPVRPPAAIASRRTEGNQKRRRKRRFCGGRTEARPRASSLRVCLADIEKEPSSRKGAALSGSGHAGNFQAHAAEAIGESHRRANYNLPASRSARRIRRIRVYSFLLVGRREVNHRGTETQLLFLAVPLW